MPEYSVDPERDGENIRVLGRQLSSNSMEMLERIDKNLKNLVESFPGSKALPYQTNPVTYQAAIAALRALRIDSIPMIYIYNSDKVPEEYLLSAFAYGHGENVNIFLSDIFNKDNLLDEAEQRFVIGHEMGHNQSAHSPNMTAEKKSISMYVSRLQEYTADRAGLIACRSLKSAVYALCKADLGLFKKMKQDLIQGVDFSSVFGEKIDSIMADILDTLPKLKKDQGTHPCFERRCAALKVISHSEMYQRLTGEAVQGKLLTDSDLQQAMKQIVC